jgi:hypothetical protein
VLKYDHKIALQRKNGGTIDFKNGFKALKFFNDPASSPWVQKDPRMCITLKTWLPLLPSEPAIVFTYRHPLEVAESLAKRESFSKRESFFSIEGGLRLWVYYNRRAIENSAGLCRVFSSNAAILFDPSKEVQRLADELTSKCGVPAPPVKLRQENVDKFVDPALQHNKAGKNTNMRVLETHGDCEVHNYTSNLKKDTPEYEKEHAVYLAAMGIFCDLKSGAAYKDDYKWPML